METVLAQLLNHIYELETERASFVATIESIKEDNDKLRAELNKDTEKGKE